LKYNEYLRVNMYEHETPPLDEVLMDGITKMPITYYPTGYSDEPVVDEGAGPYLPKWQSGPVLMKDRVNENHFMQQDVFNEVHRCAQNGVAVLGHMEYAPAGSIDHTNDKTSFYATLQSIANGMETPYNGDPMAKLYIPILDAFAFHTNHSSSVGVLVSIIHWNDYLKNVLASSVHCLVAILENTCDGFFSYSISGSESVPLGNGELHDRNFQKYQRTASLDDDKIIHDGSVDGLTLDHTTCHYRLHIYPSEVRLKYLYCVVFKFLNP
jgi:hypothetical protein